MKNIFRALADKNKRLIISMLLKGDMCVNDMLVHLPIKQATLSAHLAYLKSVGLVEMEKKGRFRIYKLKRDVLSEFVSKVNKMFGKGEKSDEVGNIIDNDVVLRR